MAGIAPGVVGLDGDREFGVVLIERGSEVGGGDTRFEVATIARVVQAAELPDGRFALATVGMRRVRVEPDGDTHRAEADRLRRRADAPDCADVDVAFKIKFDKYVEGQSFLGLEKMTLNNMVQDPSMIHEVLAYAIFRAFDVPCPRTGYATLRVNGLVLDRDAMSIEHAHGEKTFLQVRDSRVLAQARPPVRKGVQVPMP